MRMPAWPTLVGIQLVVVGALVGVHYGLEPSAPRPPPVEEQLVALDLPAAGAALEAALAAVPQARALPLGKETRARSFLSLAAQAADLQLVDLDLVAAPAVRGLSHVDLTLEVRGDLYDLPVLVDGLHRQAALVLVEGVAVESEGAAGGGKMTARLIVRYLRPDPGDGAWIEERLALAAPGADQSAPVLQQAATLLAWRQFEAQLPAYEAERDRRWDDLAHALPAGLILLREGGGRLRWDPQEGLSQR